MAIFVLPDPNFSHSNALPDPMDVVMILSQAELSFHPGLNRQPRVLPRVFCGKARKSGNQNDRNPQHSLMYAIRKQKLRCGGFSVFNLASFSRFFAIDLRV